MRIGRKGRLGILNESLSQFYFWKEYFRIFLQQKRHCIDKLTRVSVVSVSVLKVAFGDPIRNVVRAEKFGEKNSDNHEALAINVCAERNNVSLSLYDAVRKHLALSLEEATKNAPLSHCERSEAIYSR